jgi:hypothetical protein
MKKIFELHWAFEALKGAVPRDFFSGFIKQLS